MGVETLLGTVKEFVMRFSDIISNTVDADVIIADNNLKLVGIAFRYYTMYNEIDAGSLIYEVITEKKKVIVEDKSTIASCRNCKQFDSCNMVGFVGVPIYYNNYVIGAIALILPQHRVQTLFKTIDTSVEFLENMAELLAGKIKAIDEKQSLNQAIIEREAMMDLISEAVVFTDYYGNIQHFNKVFQKLFNVKQDWLGKQLQALIPHEIINDYFKDQKEFKNIRLYITWRNIDFYGFISSKQVKINGKDYGTMFFFRTVNEVLRNAQLNEKGSLVTLRWAEWMLNHDTLKLAKALAVTHNNILITGRNRNENEIIAKGITNYSERSLKGLKILNCDNIYRDLMEVFLFNEFGEIRDANNGTMLVQDVENLPLYIQSRLLSFIKTGKIPLNNHGYAESDVRFIFATTKNLKELVEEGLFSEDFYYHISQYHIEVPGIQDDYEMFKTMVQSGIEYYKKIYHKKDVKLEDKAKEFLYQCISKENLNLIEAKIEYIVQKSEGEVSIQNLQDIGLTFEKDISLSALEKEKIIELLNTNCSKTEIAKRLGIGRATLYRKMAEYDLM